MATFLIDNRENRGNKEKGDIVCVRPDSHAWSDAEKPKVISVLGLSYAIAKQYEEPLLDLTDPDNPVMIKRRKYKIDSTYFNGSELDKNKIKNFRSVDIITKT